MHVLSNEKLYQYGQLTRLTKPIGTFLLLWPTLWALWIAYEGFPPLSIIIIFCLGTFLMRSAGCVMNDLADRNFDGKVERTKSRPLAIGSISVKEAIGLFILLISLSASLLFFLHPKVFFYALTAVLLTISYPFMKRYIVAPQLVLGLAFAWGIPMAFCARYGQVPWHGWGLFAIAIIWPVIYDTMYAMVDRDDDVKIGIKSTAILFGSFDIYIVGLLQIVFFMLLCLFGYLLQFSFIYYIALLLVAGMMVYLQYLIKSRNREACFKAFLDNNYIGVFIFVGILLSYSFG